MIIRNKLSYWIIYIAFFVIILYESTHNEDTSQHYGTNGFYFISYAQAHAFAKNSATTTAHSQGDDSILTPENLKLSASSSSSSSASSPAAPLSPAIPRTTAELFPFQTPSSSKLPIDSSSSSSSASSGVSSSMEPEADATAGINANENEHSQKLAQGVDTNSKVKEKLPLVWVNPIRTKAIPEPKVSVPLMYQSGRLPPPGSRRTGTCRLAVVVALSSLEHSQVRWLEIETALKSQTSLFSRRCVHILTHDDPNHNLTLIPFDLTDYSDHVFYTSNSRDSPSRPRDNHPPTYRQIFDYVAGHIPDDTTTAVTNHDIVFDPESFYCNITFLSLARFLSLYFFFFLCSCSFSRTHPVKCFHFFDLFGFF